MWPFPGAARQALAQSHTALTQLIVLWSGQPVYSLVATAGRVTTQANRSVMRNLTATIVDPTGNLSGGDVEDLLSPYTCEVVPYRGVQVAGKSYYAPMGVFRLTQREAVGDGTVTLTGQDRALAYQGPMTGSVSIDAGTPVETAITKLLSTRHPGVTMRSWSTGFTVGPLIYQPNIDVWSEAQKLAQSAGGWLYHDRVGQLVFGSATPTSLTAVARYATGEGVLQVATRTEDADKIYNVVVVQNQASGGGAVISATAEDDDPTSPTYARGRYGRQVTVITNAAITSQAQAQQAATAQLVMQLGRTEVAQWTMVPDPTLDVLDAVVVHEPLVGLVEHTMIVDQTQIPLAATELATVTARAYINTRDGQVIQTSLATL